MKPIHSDKGGMPWREKMIKGLGLIAIFLIVLAAIGALVSSGGWLGIIVGIWLVICLIVGVVTLVKNR